MTHSMLPVDKVIKACTKTIEHIETIRTERVEEWIAEKMKQQKFSRVIKNLFSSKKASSFYTREEAESLIDDPGQGIISPYDLILVSCEYQYRSAKHILKLANKSKDFIFISSSDFANISQHYE